MKKFEQIVDLISGGNFSPLELLIISQKSLQLANKNLSNLCLTVHSEELQSIINDVMYKQNKQEAEESLTTKN